MVSGQIRGPTLPLHIKALYNNYDFMGAFAAAALLAGVALVTLAPKAALEAAIDLGQSAER